jgi:transposase
MTTPEKLFGELLGLGEAWAVERATFDEAKKVLKLHVRETPKLWASERCPQDGSDGVVCHDHIRGLRWRHLNVFNKEAEIVCDLPRGRCPTCGKVWRVTPPWEGRAKHFTKEFEAFALTLMREMPVKKAAEILGEQDTRMWRLKNPENLSRKQRIRLRQIDQDMLQTGRAYQMRLALQEIYTLDTAEAAAKRFGEWCRWVRREARKSSRWLLHHMALVADMIESHIAGILAHWDQGVTNAFMEGLNSVFSAVRRKARGYRSVRNMITMLHFVAGKLPSPAVLSH